jgi:hypothetical protein
MKKIVFFSLLLSSLSCIHNGYGAEVCANNTTNIQELVQKTPTVLEHNNKALLQEHAYAAGAALIKDPAYLVIGITFTRAVCSLDPVDKIMNLILLEHNKKVPREFILLLHKLFELHGIDYQTLRPAALKKLNMLIIAIRHKSQS